MFYKRANTKYGAKKAEYKGIKFDSVKEMHRYVFLKHLEDIGEISNLRLQVEYELIPPQYETIKVIKRGKEKEEQKLIFRKTTYRADFVYTKPDGSEVVEDVKGYVIPVYQIKEKLLYQKYGIKIRRIMKHTEAV